MVAAVNPTATGTSAATTTTAAIARVTHASPPAMAAAATVTTTAAAAPVVHQRYSLSITCFFVSAKDGAWLCRVEYLVAK